MGGGLMQLVAICSGCIPYRKSSKLIKVVYRRHTNFSKESNKNGL